MFFFCFLFLSLKFTFRKNRSVILSLLFTFHHSMSLQKNTLNNSFFFCIDYTLREIKQTWCFFFNCFCKLNCIPLSVGGYTYILCPTPTLLHLEFQSNFIQRGIQGFQ